MIKGELYEKMKFWQEEHEFGNEGSMWVSTVVLDEAKKEFPSLPVINGFSDKQIIEIVDFWATANLWFDKWFGDRNDEKVD